MAEKNMIALMDEGAKTKRTRDSKKKRKIVK